VTPVETTTAGRAGSKSASTSCSHHDPPPSKDRHEPQPLRHTEAELHETLALPGLRAGLVDLKDAEPGGDLRLSLGEGVETGTQNDVLVHAVIGLLDHQVLDEAGAGDNAGPEPLGAVGIHIWSGTPTVVGSRQPKSDLVLEDVGRRVDLHVHGAPQGDAYGRALRCFPLLVSHRPYRRR
jgi:hypothetical protein